MRFSLASELHPNATKSVMYINEVPQHIKKEMLEELGFEEGGVSFKYLGDAFRYKETKCTPLLAFNSEDHNKSYILVI